MGKQFGVLALEFLSEELELEVLKSSAGFYLGTRRPDGYPVSRESVEYFRDSTSAQQALETGNWTQRNEP